MTAQEAVKRNEKAQHLRTWQVDDVWFYVESEDGKIAYKCCISDEGDYCNCGDFATRSKSDPSFKCKHLLAVMNSVPRNQVLEAQFLEKRKPKLDERFIKTIDGKEFAIYAGLLDLAHQKNLIGIDVELLQYPTKDNDHTAVCKAIVKTATGNLYIDVGDANPVNCNSKVSKHLIRMSSTRAKARALRDMTNIGMTCLEELGDLTDIIGDDDNKKIPISKDNVRKFPKQIKSVSKPENGNGQKVEATAENQQVKDNVVPMNKKDNAAESANQQGIATGNEKAEVKGTKEAESKPAAGKAKKDKAKGNGKSKPETAPKMSEAQKNAIYNLSRRRGISIEELEKTATSSYGVSVEMLSSADASAFIRTLQQSA